MQTTDWTGTIGATADRMIFALSDENGLVDFDVLENPRLRIRHQNSTEVFEFEVEEYTDEDNDPPQYNASVAFTYDSITAGVYLCQVVAEVDGEVVRFPRDEYRRIRFLAGV